jgi:ubiquinol-cytochrome c reductase cytochrome c subunit
MTSDRSDRDEHAAAREVSRSRPVRRGRLRRRVGAAARLVAALTIVGGLYTAFAPGASHAEDTPSLSANAQRGKAMYDTSCISCHGRDAQGVPGRGPSLIGVGSAAVEFQVETGRMPAARQEAQIERKPPMFSADQARDMGAYIQSLGGGPQVPEGNDLRAGGDVARGGELFRINCSSCHAFSAGGGALSSGKYAPTLEPATDRQMYAAMLTGPQNMPVFGDNELTPQEKRDIIAYVQYQKADKDPGGMGLGRSGPVPEGVVIFVVGMVALIFATLWIAGKS